MYLRVTRGVRRRLFYLFFGYFSRVILRLADAVRLQRFLMPLARDFIHRARGFSYEFSENGELELIRKAVCKFDNGVFFDVGANIGDYCANILRASEKCANVHLFDLDSELNVKLAERFQSSNVRVNNFGLSNQNKHLTFSHFPDYPSVNSLLDVEFTHLTKAIGRGWVRTGDSYCAEVGIQRINFLKIDVEGWERFTLEGFNQMLSWNLIDVITWEYGYTTAESHWTTRDFYNYFQEKGYICGVIRKWGVDFKPWDYDLNDYTSGPNFFACLPVYKDYFTYFSD